METPENPRILVVALDADLRQSAFDLAAAEGFVVDGVADVENARKRLAKDGYALVIVEAGTELDADDVGETPRLDVSAEPLPEEAWLREAIREHTSDEDG